MSFLKKTLCGRKVESFNVKPGGAYSNHWGLRRQYSYKKTYL
jgi:hypothetical protein